MKVLSCTEVNMAQIRITQKFAGDVKQKSLILPEDTVHMLDDWFIDRIYISRKKVAIATHANSLLTFFIPYAEAGGAKNIVSCIPVLIKEFLYNHELTEFVKDLDIIFNGSIQYCKTVDRAILGHMNDFKNMIKGTIMPQYTTQHNWDQLNDEINNMPICINKKDYYYPKELFIKYLTRIIDIK